MKLALNIAFTCSLALVASSAFGLTFIAPKHTVADYVSWSDRFPDTTRIYAFGRIESDDSNRLDQLVISQGITKAMVMLDSEGGSLAAGIALGKAIRGHNFDTAIATYKDGETISTGTCASACAYAFAGGQNRYFSDGETRLGLHQFYSETTEFANETSQAVSGQLVAYLTAMGVNALAFTVSTNTEPTKMRWLTGKEAVALNLANNGIEPTTSEIKLANGVPYLKIEQSRTNITGRLLFTCVGKGIMVGAGIATDPENTTNKYEWATQSYLMADGNILALARKDKHPSSLQKVDSTIWLYRNFSKKGFQVILKAEELGIWTAADGMMTFGTVVSIAPVKEALYNFIANCR